MTANILPHVVSIYSNFWALNIKTIMKYIQMKNKEVVSTLFKILNKWTYSSSEVVNKNVMTSWISLSCSWNLPTRPVKVYDVDYMVKDKVSFKIIGTK